MVKFFVVTVPVLSVTDTVNWNVPAVLAIPESAPFAKLVPEGSDPETPNV